ncbi:hypothetical protein K490DRAFT_55169 [Saccharata proteae CBS 121410]|uniref:BTB domain-containing protein n=1 Tax=Saccharata proteae CBS 121410 TaxID=1314787 RepID=A0A6A5YDM4_9PEZI|nr:hypothetical protein K490DRAFT_55169 [Saccharata proteae CBS 121410]
MSAHGTNMISDEPTRSEDRASVTILINPEGQKFELPLQQLCDQSRFFATALKRDTWKEGRSWVVEFTHFDVSTFQIFCFWLDSREVFFANLISLAKLFALADYLDVRALRVDILVAMHKYAHHDIGSLGKLAKAFEHVPDSSAFALYIVDKLKAQAYIHHMTPLTDSIDPASIDSEFVSTLVRHYRFVATSNDNFRATSHWRLENRTLPEDPDHELWLVRTMLNGTDGDPLGETTLWDRFESESVESVMQLYDDLGNSYDLLWQPRQGGEAGHENGQ